MQLRKEHFMLLKMNPSKFGSAHDQIAIKKIQDGIVQLDHNNYFKVIRTSSINFQLKSEQEQDSIVDTYEGFLNSINFPIQVLIRTRQLDIAQYLNSINIKVEAEIETVYKQQLVHFRRFIKELIKENKILSKNFYVVIPIEIFDKSDFKVIKEQLNLRIELVKKNLNRMNITTQELDSLEIIDLFYSFYNPLKAKLQPIDSDFSSDILNSLLIKSNNPKNEI